MAETLWQQARRWLNAVRARSGNLPDVPPSEPGPQIVNLSATTVEPPQHGLSFDQAKPIVVAFAEHYRAARNITYMLGGNDKETFGSSRPGQFAELRPTHDGHNYVLIALNNAPNPQSLLETLNHEVLGHWGVNTFTPPQKRALLNRIAEARMQPGLQDLWHFVDRAYCGQSELRKAEEVYAVLAEAARPDEIADVDKGQEAWKSVVVDRNRLMTLDDLLHIQTTIHSQIRAGQRVQKTYPWRGQFSALHVGGDVFSASRSSSRTKTTTDRKLGRTDAQGSDGPIEHALTVTARGAATETTVPERDRLPTRKPSVARPRKPRM